MGFATRLCALDLSATRGFGVLARSARARSTPIPSGPALRKCEELSPARDLSRTSVPVPSRAECARPSSLWMRGGDPSALETIRQFDLYTGGARDGRVLHAIGVQPDLLMRPPSRYGRIRRLLGDRGDHSTASATCLCSRGLAPPTAGEWTTRGDYPRIVLHPEVFEAQLRARHSHSRGFRPSQLTLASSTRAPTTCPPPDRSRVGPACCGHCCSARCS